ncbi:MAG: hypothetical protein PHE26_10350 [Syntrophomonadaceae bacterium]|nr:hypothetical protein [Syntrophomonadaceae bacterium]
MKKRWGKGEPVNLSDLLKITPVANEIIQLSDELDISSTDLMWIVAQIIDNNEEIGSSHSKIFGDEDISEEDEWGEMDLESLEDEIDQAVYAVNVRINGGSRFPEIAFKAGINSKEDINYFFDMIMEMLDKLD